MSARSLAAVSNALQARHRRVAANVCLIVELAYWGSCPFEFEAVYYSWLGRGNYCHPASRATAATEAALPTEKPSVVRSVVGRFLGSPINFGRQGNSEVVSMRQLS